MGETTPCCHFFEIWAASEKKWLYPVEYTTSFGERTYYLQIFEYLFDLGDANNQFQNYFFIAKGRDAQKMAARPSPSDLSLTNANAECCL